MQLEFPQVLVSGVVILNQSFSDTKLDWNLSIHFLSFLVDTSESLNNIPILLL